jgi:hypothetical protein
MLPASESVLRSHLTTFDLVTWLYLTSPLPNNGSVPSPDNVPLMVVRARPRELSQKEASLFLTRGPMGASYGRGTDSKHYR